MDLQRNHAPVSPLDDASRLATLYATGLLDSPREEEFDRITDLAGRLLNVPAVMVNLIDADRTFVKSGPELPEPWNRDRTTPLSRWFCSEVTATGRSLVVPDARKHPGAADDFVTRDLGVVAYLGVPLVTSNGHVLGSFCAADVAPREWSDDDLHLLTDLSRFVVREIEFRLQLHRNERDTRLLREREERYRLAARATRDAVWDWDLATDHVEWSEALRALFGHAEESVSGTRADWRTEHIHPDDRSRVAESIERAINGSDEHWTQEYRFFRADGSVAHVLDRGFLLRDDAGTPTRMIGAMLDVTAQKRIEVDLRDASDRLDLALSAAQGGTWLWDVVNNIVYPDENMVRIFSIPQEYAAGGAPAAVFIPAVHPDDQPALAAHVRAALEATGTDYESEYRVCQPDGSYRWIVARGKIQRDQEGRAIAMPGAFLDITERKEAEQERERVVRELSEERALLQALLDQLPAGIVVTRPPEKEAFLFNRRVQEILRISEAEMERRQLDGEQHIYGPDGTEIPAEEGPMVRSALYGETIQDQEFLYERGDLRLNLLVSTAPVRNEEGKIVLVVGTFIDITDRKQAEQERERLNAQVEAERALLDGVLRNMPLSVVIAEAPSGRFIHGNTPIRSAWTEQIADTPLENYGQFVGYHPDGQPYDAREWPMARSLTSGEVVIAEEIEIETEAGTRRIVSVNSSPVRDAEGNIIAAVAISEDITERKRSELELLRLNESLEHRVTERTADLEWANKQLTAEINERARMEEALRESEGRYRSLITDVIDHIAVGVFILDADLHIVWVNQAVSRFLGIPREEIIGKPKRILIDEKIKHVFEDPETFAQTLKAAYDVNSVVEHFECHVLPGENREERWLEHWSRPIREGFYSGGRMSLYSDITDVKRMLQRLEQANLELKHRNRELQEFAYVASHDLQEPLRKVRAFADLLTMDFGDRLDDQGRHYLERMHSAAGRMSTLISDLLSFSRVMTTASPVGTVNLNRIIETVLQDLQVQLEESGGQVEIDELPAIEADVTQMRQLFQNLISNALKFRRPDVPPIIRISATASPGSSGTDIGPRLHSDRGTTYQFRVADNGIGFEQEYADKIFMPFQRLHGVDRYTGTGIGLAICRRIVERHFGTIRAEGIPGQGSTFVIDLPARQPRRSPVNPLTIDQSIGGEGR